MQPRYFVNHGNKATASQHPNRAPASADATPMTPYSLPNIPLLRRAATFSPFTGVAIFVVRSRGHTESVHGVTYNISSSRPLRHAMQRPHSQHDNKRARRKSTEHSRTPARTSTHARTHVDVRMQCVTTVSKPIEQQDDG